MHRQTELNMTWKSVITKGYIREGYLRVIRAIKLVFQFHHMYRKSEVNLIWILVITRVIGYIYIS